VAAGKKPVVEFELAPELTKSMTFLLYKWILTSHLYLYYNAIQAALRTQPDITSEEIYLIVENQEGEKVKRRYLLLVNLLGTN